MSEELQARLRLVLTILTWVIRTHSWKLLLTLLIWCIKERLSWLEAMDRLSGEYYAQQVRDAVADYKRRTNWQPVQTSDPNFKKWIDSQK